MELRFQGNLPHRLRSQRSLCRNVPFLPSNPRSVAALKTFTSRPRSGSDYPAIQCKQQAEEERSLIARSIQGAPNSDTSLIQYSWREACPLPISFRRPKLRFQRAITCYLLLPPSHSVPFRREVLYQDPGDETRQRTPLPACLLFAPFLSRVISSST